MDRAAAVYASVKYTDGRFLSNFPHPTPTARVYDNFSRSLLFTIAIYCVCVCVFCRMAFTHMSV
jgi:hypothetical protein